MRALSIPALWLAAMLLGSCGAPEQSATVEAHQASARLLTDAAWAGKRLIAVGEYGQILHSDDSGKHWESAQSPSTALLTAVFFVDDRHGWAVGHDMTILHTDDGGLTWQQQFAAPDENRPLLDTFFQNSDKGWAVGAYGAMLTTADGGKSWHNRQRDEDDRHLNAMTMLADGTLMLVGETGTVRVSHDAGTTWETIKTPYSGSFFGAVQAPDGAWILHGLRGTILRTDDEGATWTSIEGAPKVGLMGSALLPDGTIMLVGAAGTVLISHDSGRSFRRMKNMGTRTYTGILPDGSNRVFLLGEGGIRTVSLHED